MRQKSGILREIASVSWRSYPPAGGSSPQVWRVQPPVSLSLRRGCSAISAAIRPSTRRDAWHACCDIRLRMNPRSVVKKNLEVATIVVVSTILAIGGADHFERSGPDRKLLRQLKEMQEARRERGQNVGMHYLNHARSNASTSRTMDRYAQR